MTSCQKPLFWGCRQGSTRWQAADLCATKKLDPGRNSRVELTFSADWQNPFAETVSTHQLVCRIAIELFAQMAVRFAPRREPASLGQLLASSDECPHSLGQQSGVERLAESFIEHRAVKTGRIVLVAQQADENRI